MSQTHTHTHSVKKKKKILKLLVSKPRRGLFEDFKSLKSTSGPVLGDRTITRNLLSSTTHLGGIRTFLEEDPFMKVVRHDQWILWDPQKLHQEPSVLHNTIWKA